MRALLLLAAVAVVSAGDAPTAAKKASAVADPVLKTHGVKESVWHKTPPLEKPCLEDQDCGGKDRGICTDFQAKPGFKRCLCKSPWTGPYCDIKDKEVSEACEPPCLNGGKCEAEVCKCPRGFAGEQCQASGCPQNCNGRGECITVPGEDRAKCMCNGGNGWTGSACQRRICPFGPKGGCNQQGECSDGKCKCSGDFAGPSQL